MDTRPVESDEDSTGAETAGRCLFGFFKERKVEQHRVTFIFRNPTNGLVLDAAQGDVKIQRYDGRQSQFWKLECTDYGRFFIVSPSNGYILKIAGGPTPGNKLTSVPKIEGQIYEHEMWHIAGDGTIRSAGPFDLVLDIPAPRTPGTTVIAYNMEKGTKLVLEQVVTTIASVADTAETEFIAYYDRLMPCLKYIIQNANKDELKLLRGKTIECVTLIGMAVGTEKFMADATEVMDMLLKTHGEGAELPDDDPQTSYLISAWSRICKVLGKNFEQYLPLVMGPVMRTAAMKPDVALLDNEDMQGVEGADDWQFASLGEQKNFGIRTAGLEDKAAACMMLVCYARELKESFANYAEETVKLMVPMLKFYFHDGVRNAAAEFFICIHIQ